MPKIKLAILFIFIALKAQAQTWELGISGGGSGYMGDLNPRNLLKISGPSAGLMVKRNFNPYLSLKLNYTYGKITGDDSTSPDQEFRDRNLSFNTQLNELALITEFNFLKYTPGVGENVFTPFIYLGIGAVNYNPQATYKGVVYDLRPLMTEGQSKPYPSLAMAIPYGLGFKVNFTGKWNFSADIGYRNPGTDYLDDVSGVYADKTKFTNPIALALSDRSGEKAGVYTGSAGSQRGDLRKHDTYLFLNFTLSFTFVTQNCYY